VESLEKRLQQMEKLLQPLKEQKIVDDDNDDNENKKPTSYSTKKPRLNPKDSVDMPFSRFIPPNDQNQSQFHDTYNHSSYAQNDYTNFQVRSQNEHIPKSIEQLMNNDNSKKDKQISGKDEDELIYFGNTSIKPGFIHKSDLCGNGPDTPGISDGSTTSESANSEATTPIVQIHNLPNPRAIVVSDYLPIDVVEHLASCFFRFIDVQMSMFHEATFMRHLRQNKVSAFLVFSMCAASARYATHPSVARKPPYLSGDPFAAVATKMILQSFDFPSVEHVQAYILLALHMFGSCRGPKAWMYIGMAVRMAQEIGLHKIDEVPVGSQPTKVKSEAIFIQRETRRRTFWSCFLLDRYSSCAVGRPTLIDEDDCDVRLPCNEAIWNYDHPFSKSLIEEYFKEVHVKQDSRITLTNNGLCACFVSVTALLGRVSQFINRSKPSNSPPPWNPQSQFSILANETDMWYNSILPHYAYNKERLQKLVANGTGVIFATFHLLYYATVITLHKQIVAALQNNENLESNDEFMYASEERCRSASKIVVSISSDILQHGRQCLCPFTVYPIFLSTTILINDLYSSDNTIANEAKRDLERVEKYLTTMGPYWGMANKFLFMINEMRKAREEQNEEPKDVFNNTERRNSEQMSEGTDAGLLAFWNRTDSGTTNMDDISSIILPEEFVSPRWLGNSYDPSMSSDSWTNILRSSGPMTPRALSRYMKKEKNPNGENSTENDYFSQEALTYNFPPPVFEYSLLDMSALNSNNFDWAAGTLNRPHKHWSTINGNNMNEESSTNDTNNTTTNNTSNTAS